MGYPLGLAPTTDGTGLSPEDHQRVIWSLFRSQAALIVRGGEVTGTSGMSYKVAPGVVYVPTGEDRAVLVPFEGTTVATTAAPSTGSRVDFIHAGLDGAAKVGPSVPPGSALLGKRTITAGMTATSAAADSRLDRRYAMLFGASMGRLGRWIDSSGWRAVWPTTPRTVYSLAVNLSSDRLLDFRLTQSLASDATSSIVWEVWLDQSLLFAPELAVSSIGESKTYTASEWVLGGQHTITLKARGGVNGGKPVLHIGGGTENRPGNRFEVVDLGLIW